MITVARASTAVIIVAASVLPGTTAFVRSFAGDVGVAECDRYLQQYETCISRIPDASEAAANEAALRAQRDAMKQTLIAQGGAETLVPMCKFLIEGLASRAECK